MLAKTKVHPDQLSSRTVSRPKDKELLTPVRTDNLDANPAARAAVKLITGSGLVENFQK